MNTDDKLYDNSVTALRVAVSPTGGHLHYRVPLTRDVNRALLDGFIAYCEGAFGTSAIRTVGPNNVQYAYDRNGTWVATWGAFHFAHEDDAVAFALHSA